MSTHQTQKNRLQDLWRLLCSDEPTAAADYFHPDFELNAAHPINQQHGAVGFFSAFWLPLKQAVPDIERSPYILMASQFKEQDWLSSTGYFNGTFTGDWLGIPATGEPVQIHFGDFWRMEGDKIIECVMIVDIPDVMRQAGYAVLPPDRGVPGYVPAPYAGDGMMLNTDADAAETAHSIALVEAMIFEGLMAYDGQNLSSMNMVKYWDHNMRWYGPAGIGKAHSLKEFEDFHQIPFLHAFPDRRGGNHKARVAEGLYVGSTGWPSIQATHAGEYLGAAATNKRITMRVMDWWRREGDTLLENWVFIDLIDLFLQFDVDLFERMTAQIRR